MSAHSSGRVGVCLEALRRVQQGDVAAYGELFADDAVMAFPFAPDGFPRRMRGPGEIVATLAPLWRRAWDAGRRITGFDDVRWHECDDGETVVAEFDMAGVAVRSGQHYRLSYVHVYRIVDAKIVELRDYFDPSALLRLPS
jgi:ketosteroid isomerase-like protein